MYRAIHMLQLYIYKCIYFFVMLLEKKIINTCSTNLIQNIPKVTENEMVGILLGRKLTWIPERTL